MSEEEALAKPAPETREGSAATEEGGITADEATGGASVPPGSGDSPGPEGPIDKPSVTESPTDKPPVTESPTDKPPVTEADPEADLLGGKLAAAPVTATTAKLHLQISNAFKVFDHEQNNTIDIR